VLFDLHKSDETLPWQINVHLTHYPDAELMRLSARAPPSSDDSPKTPRHTAPPFSLDAVESHFVQSIKEADAVRHKGEVVGAMEKRDTKAIWNALCTSAFIYVRPRYLMVRKVRPVLGEEQAAHRALERACRARASRPRLHRASTVTRAVDGVL